MMLNEERRSKRDHKESKMKRTMLSAALLAMIILGVAAVSAQDMPTGPPKEMKQLAFLVGEWDVDMDMNMGTENGMDMDTDNDNDNDIDMDMDIDKK